jgi:hypothetical protein
MANRWGGRRADPARSRFGSGKESRRIGIEPGQPAIRLVAIVPAAVGQAAYQGGIMPQGARRSAAGENEAGTCRG